MLRSSHKHVSKIHKIKRLTDSLRHVDTNDDQGDFTSWILYVPPKHMKSRLLLGI